MPATGARHDTDGRIAQDTPGLNDKFQLPDPETDQAILTAGRLFARDAEAFRTQFIVVWPSGRALCISRLYSCRMPSIPLSSGALR
jgi:hypothetical protein